MLILPPFTVGETAELYAPREFACSYVAPDGTVTVVDNPNEKLVAIPLTTAGIYRYKFSDGSTGEIVVREAPKQTAAP